MYSDQMEALLPIGATLLVVVWMILLIALNGA